MTHTDNLDKQSNGWQWRGGLQTKNPQSSVTFSLHPAGLLMELGQTLSSQFVSYHQHGATLLFCSTKMTNYSPPFFLMFISHHFHSLSQKQDESLFNFVSVRRPLHLMPFCPCVTSVLDLQCSSPSFQRPPYPHTFKQRLKR